MSIEALRDIQRASDSAFAAGGPASIGRAAVAVAPAVRGQAVATVTVAGITATSKVMCQIEPSADWDADDLDGFEVRATPGDGEIAFCIMSPGPIGGDFSILYMVG